jgi:hypothetical protein
MNKDEETPKCAQAPCPCAPRSGDAYCSEYCKHAATSGPPRNEPVCACGHADCERDRAAAAAPAA